MELSQKDHAEFYKHIAQDWNEPMEAFSFKAEGLHEYQALLFIPAKAPQDLYYHAPDCGLQLYARGVGHRSPFFETYDSSDFGHLI